MSVRGEFARTVSDTIRCLQAVGGARAAELARGLERARADSRDDLTRAAAAVLAEWDPSPADAMPVDVHARARLVEAAEYMVSIAKVVLGR